jgi:hypothetical protein
MSGHSSIDSLRRLAPVSDSDAAEVFGAGGREELLVGVTSSPLGRRRPIRRRPLIVALALVVAAGTATGAWAIFHSPAQETTSVECVIKGIDTIIPASSGDPAADCAAQWRRDEGTTAPPLRAYDNGDGGVTVIPSSAAPPAGFERLVSGQDVDLIQLQDSLDDFVNGLNSSCLTSTAATGLTQAKLAQFGFTGWTVTKKAPTETSDGSICWNTDVVDPGTQTITLIAAPDQNGSPQTLLADKLRPITQSCESLRNAVADARSAADGLGLSESARTYELNAVMDNSLRCASVYETVGGTIFLTVRGPSG